MADQERQESVNIGSAWKKLSKDNKPYISGKFNNGKYFAIFTNPRKQPDSNQPDYRMVMGIDDGNEMDLLDDWTKENKLGKASNSAGQKDVIVEDFPDDKPIDLSEIPF